MDAGTRARSASGSIAEKVRKERRETVLEDMSEPSFTSVRKFSPRIYTRNFLLAMPLRVADKISRQKYKKAADNYLKGRLQQRRIHVSMPDVGNDRELDGYDNHGDQSGHVKIGNQKRHGVSDAA